MENMEMWKNENVGNLENMEQWKLGTSGKNESLENTDNLVIWKNWEMWKNVEKLLKHLKRNVGNVQKNVEEHVEKK